MQVVILGWDALDAELVEQHGLTERFGRTSKIGTYVNPVISHPHTRELWPSMISGQHPDHHGIHAVSGNDGVEWEDAWLNNLSDLAAGIVPKAVRIAIGRRLRERGAGLDAKRPRYYHENAIPTVFDDGGKPISIPNYQTEFDRRYGLDGNRDDVWAAILPDRDGAQGMAPSVGLPAVMQTLGGAMGERVGHTLAAMDEGHDLVWTWFGLLDTVGHIAPAMEADVERLGYQMAARATETIRDAADEETLVVCLSDHGLQDGDHTDYATVATDADGPHDAISHVFDVFDWVQEARSGTEGARSGYDADEVEAMTDQLEQLGYVS